MRDIENIKEEIREKLNDTLRGIIAASGLGTPRTEYEVLSEERDKSLDIVHKMFYAKRNAVLRELRESHADRDMEHVSADSAGDAHYENLSGSLTLPVGLMLAVARSGYEMGPHGGVVSIRLMDNLRLLVRMESPGLKGDFSYALELDSDVISVCSDMLYASEALSDKLFEKLLRTADNHSKTLSPEIGEKVSEVLVARQERRIFETALPHFVKAFGQENDLQYSIDFYADDFDADAVMKVKLTQNKCVAFPLTIDGFAEEFGRIVPVVKELRTIQRTLSAQFSIESEMAVTERIDRLESRHRQSKANIAFMAGTSYASTLHVSKATSPLVLMRSAVAELNMRGMEYDKTENSLLLAQEDFIIGFSIDEESCSAAMSVEYRNPFREMKSKFIIPSTQCIAVSFSDYFSNLICGLGDFGKRLYALLEEEDAKHSTYYRFQRNVRNLIDEEILGYDFNHILTFDSVPSCLAFLNLEIDEGLYVTVRLTPTTYQGRIRSVVGICGRLEKLRNYCGIQFEYQSFSKYMKWKKAV